jgi:FAD/FMN-containing dehydrogenase
MTEGMAQWQIAELAIRCGDLLGMPLDRAWDGHGVRIGTEGNGLYLSEPYHQRGRLQISGWYPDSRTWPRGAVHITVRADRGPRAIAAEVTRRLLPAYRATVAEIREYDARQQAEQQARDRLAGYVTGLFPSGLTSMPDHCQSDYQSEVILYLAGHLGGHVKFHGDGSEVELERFRVPAAVALRMLETVALLAQPHGE